LARLQTLNIWLTESVHIQKNVFIVPRIAGCYTHLWTLLTTVYSLFLGYCIVTYGRVVCNIFFNITKIIMLLYFWRKLYIHELHTMWFFQFDKVRIRNRTLFFN
jgi:hypothetical protein